MNHKSFLGAVGFVATSLLGAHAHAGAVYDELSDTQKTTVQKGQQVVIEQPVSGSPWPMLTIYQRADSGAEEIAAVFGDFARHKDYFEGIIQSYVQAEQPAPNQVIVEYVLKMPFPLRNDEYKMKNSFAFTDEVYKISWSMQGGSTHAKSGEGNFRTETLGTGALVSYRNSVVPKSGLAGAVRERALDQAKKTVQMAIKRTQSVQNKSPELLAEELAALRKYLGRE